MTDVVNLEQLNYRDQMIKEYIDQHSGGGGSSDFIPAQLALSRFRDEKGNTDEQHLYLGVVSGTDISDISIKYVRVCGVKNRNKNLEISGHKNKWRGLHEVWAIPQKDKVPLIQVAARSEIAFTKSGYDYHELYFLWDGDEYEMLDFINQGFESGYFWQNEGVVNPVYITRIMNHNRGGIVLMKDDKVISGHLKFHTEYCDDYDTWRMTLY